MASKGNQQTRTAGVMINDNASLGSQSTNIKNAVGTAAEGSRIIAGDYNEVKNSSVIERDM